MKLFGKHPSLTHVCVSWRLCSRFPSVHTGHQLGAGPRPQSLSCHLSRTLASPSLLPLSPHDVCAAAGSVVSCTEPAADRTGQRPEVVRMAHPTIKNKKFSVAMCPPRPGAQHPLGQAASPLPPGPLRGRHPAPAPGSRSDASPLSQAKPLGSPLAGSPSSAVQTHPDGPDACEVIISDLLRRRASGGRVGPWEPAPPPVILLHGVSPQDNRRSFLIGLRKRNPLEYCNARNISALLLHIKYIVGIIPGQYWLMISLSVGMLYNIYMCCSLRNSFCALRCVLWGICKHIPLFAKFLDWNF